MRGVAVLVATVLLALLWGCSKQVVPEPYKPTDDHEAYSASLEQVDLHLTALGRDWIGASKSAIEAPVRVTLPLQEEIYFSASRAEARGFAFSVLQGQKIRVAFQQTSATELLFFLDLFRTEGEDTTPVHVASGNREAAGLEVDVRVAGQYILRLQPELLRGGSFTLNIQSGPSLAFPVKGRDTKALISFFGDPRDGGERIHQGIDILAPRGTEVLAPTSGFVRRVGINDKGGNIVWLEDRDRGLSLYFAHLDTQLVESGDQVSVGDVLGTVGNTGNARTTAPHLHFGVYMTGEYRRGAVDPFNFVNDPGGSAPPITVDSTLLGGWLRIKADGSSLERSGAVEQRTLPLPRGTLLLSEGANGHTYRVSLPNGVSGYIDSALVEVVRAPLRTSTAAEPVPVYDSPNPGASLVTKIGAGATITVLGIFGHHWLIETGEGVQGWVEVA